MEREKTIINTGRERKGDFRVPLLFVLFFISCLIGGIILLLWFIDAKGAQPWFPILALVLIGFPWIFWVLVCCYTIIRKSYKKCGRDGGETRINSLRMIPEDKTNEDLRSRRDPSLDTSDKKRPVQSAPAIVADTAESSIAPNKESKTPLNRYVPS